MNAVINFEYLVSPALSDDFYFDKVVDNLRICLSCYLPVFILFI